MRRDTRCPLYRVLAFSHISAIKQMVSSDGTLEKPSRMISGGVFDTELTAFTGITDQLTN